MAEGAEGVAAGLRVARLDPRARLPVRGHPGDAGLDLCALDAVALSPGERVAVPTGLVVAIPDGHAGLVLPRSGLATRHGVTVPNAPGLIDAGYRGELVVWLVNLDPATRCALAAGDRVAQLVIVPVVVADTEEVDPWQLADEPTSRGAGGFGSTGRR